MTLVADGYRAATLEEVLINEELLVRPARPRKTGVESTSLHALAYAATHGPDLALKTLAKLAVDLCDADSAGISTIVTESNGSESFRWRALAGLLEPYEGGSTPRDWSPCGECLRLGKPALYAYPARYFTYFDRIDIPIVEGLVVPMSASGPALGTIWIVSHTQGRHFCAEDVRVMTSLGSFVSSVLKISTERRYRRESEPSAAIDRAAIERELVWTEYLKRISMQDQFALAALMDETHPLVFGVALRILSFRADAEEIASDVYAAVWKFARAYSPGRGSVRGWLTTMSRNRAINRLRTRVIQRRSEETLYRPCLSVTPEDHARAAEKKVYVLKALAALPKEQAQAIQLAYFGGLTSAQIAKRLHQPVGSVKTRIRLGLMKLRLRLAAVT